MRVQILVGGGTLSVGFTRSARGVGAQSREGANRQGPRAGVS